MAVSLLRTKLYIPPVRPEILSRPRLVERLSAGLDQGCRLTLVSAPAGFGKTTLLSEWVHSRSEVPLPPRVAWLSLDEGDNDPARFWSYVIAALRSIPELGDADVGAAEANMLRSPQPPPMETLLIELINDLADCALLISAADADPQTADARCRCILVLDDLHTITNIEVSKGLAFLLDNLPPHLHLVIATRSDPVLPLSRLRGRGQLTELSTADLRFTAEEVAALLNQVMGLGLSAEQVAALEARTEGWIVGLQMAARALQAMLSSGTEDAGSVSDFVSAFAGSHRYVLDYLTDEVLSQEPEPVQTFLLRTSILKRLSGPLCDAVCGAPGKSTPGPGGQGMLERLDAANLFTVPLDAERRWYRYHHLFADLLSKRLQRTDPGLVPELHSRASAWYEDAGLVEDAIAHAFAGEDHQRAARLVEQHAVEQMMASRKEAAFAEWLEALPAETVHTRPWLCVYQGWTRYWRGKRDQVEECLQYAEQALHGMPAASEVAAAGVEGTDRTEVELMTGYIAAIRAHHALTNREIPRVVEMAHRAIDLLPEGDYMRCEAAVALGGAYWSQGDAAASQAAFSQARTTALLSGYRPLAVPSGCYVAVQQIKQGQLREAYATYREALEWATGPGGRRLPVAGFPLIRLGDLSREWNEMEAAERDVTHGLDLCAQLGQADVLAEAYVMRARLQLTQGDLNGVRDSLEEVDRITQRVKIDPWIACWADECRLRAWLSTGNLSATVRWMELSGLDVDGELDYQRDLHHTNLARALIARGIGHAQETDLLDTLRLLERLAAAAQNAEWHDTEIQVSILRALALQAAHREDEALAALEHALFLAQAGGYVRTFLDEGPSLVRLLRQAADDAAPGYASQLLAAAEEPSATQEPPAETFDLSLVEPLSDRETEVLQLIAEGLSNRQVGERLYITQGTVKAHTSNIYGKLGVRNRTQAVARARALGMVR